MPDTPLDKRHCIVETRDLKFDETQRLSCRAGDLVAWLRHPSPLLACRYGQRDVSSQGSVACRILRPQRVLDKKRSVRFQGLAHGDDMGRIQASVDIEADLNIRTDGLPNHLHLLFGYAHGLYRLKNSGGASIFKTSTCFRLSSRIYPPK